MNGRRKNVFRESKAALAAATRIRLGIVEAATKYYVKNLGNNDPAQGPYKDSKQAIRVADKAENTTGRAHLVIAVSGGKITKMWEYSSSADGYVMIKPEEYNNPEPHSYGITEAAGLPPGVRLGSPEHARLVAQYQAAQGPKTSMSSAEFLKKLKDSTLPQEDYDTVAELIDGEPKITASMLDELEAMTGIAKDELLACSGLTESSDPYHAGVESLIAKRPNLRPQFVAALRAYADACADGADEVEAAEEHLKPHFTGASGAEYYEKLLGDLREVGALIENWSRFSGRLDDLLQGDPIVYNSDPYDKAESEKEGVFVKVLGDGEVEIKDAEGNPDTISARNIRKVFIESKDLRRKIREATPDTPEGFDPNNQPSFDDNQQFADDPDASLEADNDAVSIDKLDGDELRDKFGDDDVFEITDPASEVGVYFVSVDNSEKNPQVSIATIDGDGNLTSDNTEDLVARVQELTSECHNRRAKRMTERKRRKLKEEGGDPESIVDEQPVEIELVIDEEPEAVTVSGDVCDVLSALVGDDNADLMIASISGEGPEVDEFTADHAEAGPEDLPTSTENDQFENDLGESVLPADKISESVNAHLNAVVKRTRGIKESLTVKAGDSFMTNEGEVKILSVENGKAKLQFPDGKVIEQTVQELQTYWGLSD